jgi:hypothetical protein
MPVPSGKYSRFENGGLPVNCSVIMLSHNISHPPRRVGTAGQASESRRQLVLAVASGARSAWSMASGGGCVAGRARVDHGCVRARVVGKRKPHMPQPGAMADASNVRHDTIVVPETMSPAQVRALAERKAQAQVGDDGMVAFLHLHGSRPVGGEHGTEVEWRYSYQVIPSGGPAADTAS